MTVHKSAAVVFCNEYAQKHNFHYCLISGLQLTVHESLIFSARLRFEKHVDLETVYAFVQEIMELVELEPLGQSLVGRPGIDGLSVEQRKRLTIAVELVANPSIVFMDEPTSGQCL